jgi:DNA helicase-2/ATP-dependent DNA helicase PcrA
MELPQEELDFYQPKTTFPAEGLPHSSFDDAPYEGDDLEFPPRSAVDSTVPSALPRLTTAAELLTQSETTFGAVDPAAPRISPEAFHQGMVVRHPEYGVGKIVALSGIGIKRKATVMFAGGAGEKKFLLVHSPLRPAGR